MYKKIYSANLKKNKKDKYCYFKKGDEHLHNFFGSDLDEAQLSVDYLCKKEGWDQVSKLRYLKSIEINAIEFDESLTLDDVDNLA